MKQVIAIIKQRKLSPVTLALHGIEGLSGATVSEVRGFGRGRAKNAPDKINEDAAEFMPRVRLEIFCPDALMDQVVETIESTAKTGLRGDGKIYVNDVLGAVRISSGERGDSAV